MVKPFKTILVYLAHEHVTGGWAKEWGERRVHLSKQKTPKPDTLYCGGDSSKDYRRKVFHAETRGKSLPFCQACVAACPHAEIIES